MAEANAVSGCVAVGACMSSGCAAVAATGSASGAAGAGARVTIGWGAGVAPSSNRCARRCGYPLADDDLCHRVEDAEHQAASQDAGGDAVFVKDLAEQVIASL